MATTNVIVGFVLALATQIALFPVYHFDRLWLEAVLLDIISNRLKPIRRPAAAIGNARFSLVVFGGGDERRTGTGSEVLTERRACSS